MTLSKASFPACNPKLLLGKCNKRYHTKWFADSHFFMIPSGDIASLCARSALAQLQGAYLAKWPICTLVLSIVNAGAHRTFIRGCPVLRQGTYFSGHSLTPNDVCRVLYPKCLAELGSEPRLVRGKGMNYPRASFIIPAYPDIPIASRTPSLVSSRSSCSS
jgi:hypothetical protein